MRAGHPQLREVAGVGAGGRRGRRALAGGARAGRRGGGAGGLAAPLHLAQPPGAGRQGRAHQPPSDPAGLRLVLAKPDL